MANSSVLPAAGVEGRSHHFPADRVHFTWDVDHEPVLTVASGDTVVVQTRDVSDNQITPESTAADLDIDWDRVYPLAGPIAVEGAQPGHTLAIEILDLHPLGWGWTAILPELGLLPDDFPIHTCGSSTSPAATSRSSATTSRFRSPVPGNDGGLPAGASQQKRSCRPLLRREHGHAPAHPRDDALPAGAGRGSPFSCGDAHAAQGDGEVCVTGIECPMYAALRFTLDEERSIPAPQYQTAPGPLTPKVDSGGFYGTTGVGPDLYVAAQEAVRAMIDHLAEGYDLSREDAYVLEPLRRSQDLGDRRRGPVRRQCFGAAFDLSRPGGAFRRVLIARCGSRRVAGQARQSPRRGLRPPGCLHQSAGIHAALTPLEVGSCCPSPDELEVDVDPESTDVAQQPAGAVGFVERGIRPKGNRALGGVSRSSAALAASE